MDVEQHPGLANVQVRTERQRRHDTPRMMSPRRSPFDAAYDAHYARLFGYVNRLCGEPDLAADIVQEAFVKLHHRRDMPESLGSWLVTVATNLLRNARSRGARRVELARSVLGDSPPALPMDRAVLEEERERVRHALNKLPHRDRELLSLLAGGYSYREMATALDLNESSVGTLLARAKQAFRAAYGDRDDSP